MTEEREDADSKQEPSDQPADLKASHTPSPAGVNRRTAVLFSSKKGARNPPASTPPMSPPPAPADQPPLSPQPHLRKLGRSPKNKHHQQQLHVDISEPRSPESSHSRGPASPVGPFTVGRKRSSSLGHPSESESRPSLPKRAMSVGESTLAPIADASITQHDSFKNYRIRNIRSSSESDTTSELSSGDESESSTATSSNHSPSGESGHPRQVYFCVQSQDYIMEGCGPEWYISSMLCSQDIPFWSVTFELWIQTFLTVSSKSHSTTC